MILAEPVVSSCGLASPQRIGYFRNIILIPVRSNAQTLVHFGFRSVACLQIHGDEFQQHQREYDDCSGQLRVVVEREHASIHQIRCKRQHGNGISAAINDMKCVFTIAQSTGSTGGRRRLGVNRWPRLTVIVMMDWQR